MAVFQAMPWHEGEDLMHRKLQVPSDLDNPSVPMLSQQAARTLSHSPLLAIGTVDTDGRPWTSIWGGESNFSRPLGQSILGIRTQVAAKYDPVVEALVGGNPDGTIVREEGHGRMVSGLTIDLAARKRVKLYGRMMAGALGELEPDNADNHAEASVSSEIQLVMRVEQSLGNCPKYLNTKLITPAPAQPRLISDSPLLSAEALSLIGRADMFFLSSRHEMSDMDTNHRGGPPGFVRVHTETTSTTLFWPEYSGNRLYQTLGNLQVTPLAGLCFPDFVTGNVLYLTGNTAVLVGADAANILPRSNLVVKLTVTAARLVAEGLPFRGEPGDLSPYNPKVRYLESEQEQASSSSQPNSAELLSQIRLTPSISRFHFRLASPTAYTSGQYVTLDFSDHLNTGYSHMRDDDPLSINDDFVRTFTVSNAPSATSKSENNEFEITIRRIGPVTNFLFKHGLEGPQRDSLPKIEVKGFGGSFKVEQVENAVIGFIAGGVGITPLLPALHYLDPKRLTVLWALRSSDLSLAIDVLRTHPNLAKSFRIFVTGTSDKPGDETSGSGGIEAVQNAGAIVVERRLQAEDVRSSGVDLVEKWYMCTGTPMRKQLLQWLEGKETIYEDFNF